MLTIINRIKCKFGRHDYALAQNITDHSRRLYCEQCHKSFGMCDDTRSVIPWDSELHDMYANVFGIDMTYLDKETGIDYSKN